MIRIIFWNIYGLPRKIKDDSIWILFNRTEVMAITERHGQKKISI